ncbi:MAG: hypothetical protein COB94_005480 [Gammaproteobacteria bacterium]|nr:hypothetical protein [Gammaproteobacteria bacterium]
MKPQQTLIAVNRAQVTVVLESFCPQLDEVEDQILGTAANDALEKIDALKRKLILLRRRLWPQPEVINRLLRDDHTLVQRQPGLFARPLRPHPSGDGSTGNLSPHDGQHAGYLFIQR